MLEQSNKKISNKEEYSNLNNINNINGNKNDVKKNGSKFNNLKSIKSLPNKISFNRTDSTKLNENISISPSKKQNKFKISEQLSFNDLNKTNINNNNNNIDYINNIKNNNFEDSFQIPLKINKEKEHIPIMDYDTFLLKREFKHGSPVYLNVYHIAKIINLILQIFGIGIYHTTLEINDYEYSFGLTNKDVPGIFKNNSGELKKKLKLKEKIYLGNTLYDIHTIYNILYLQSPYWMGRTYDPFVKNCNHFTKFFAKIILNDNVNYPLYINRLSKYGMFFSSFYPPIKRIYGYFAGKITNENFFVLGEDINLKNLSAKNLNKININDNKTENNNKIDNNDKLINKSTNKQYDNKEINKSNDSKNKNNEIEINNNEINIDIDSENKSDDSSTEDKYDIIFQKLFLMDPFKFNNVINYSYILKKTKYNVNLNSFFSKLKDAEDFLFTIDNNRNNSIIFKQAESKLISTLSLLNEFESSGENPLNKYLLKNLINKNFEQYNIFKKYPTLTIFLKVKIYHDMNFLFYISGNMKKQEKVYYNLNYIDKDFNIDYYAYFSLSYIKYKQFKYPESEILLEEAIELSIKDNNNEYNLMLNKFKEFFLN